ncbi:glyoxalase/bleomycin resistance/dioxygenase family protein [Massilia arenosa]|uniref:Glyoxalase/bleomycin resistance/dioxygenase family protein n=1 Tax=Zemynaea arenosa TaxID=2561931 RepID=A0A4Y9S3S6_9BURK|nr:ArsI/CadI family heavy metal resistance metalloenzyme [Massilia arenosa]TFW16055.1 glyoxalase/bleomycin resistance/dioxygenase family protein [Massilia arenosa]
MKRLHVHVSVDQLQTSIDFYSTMFGTAPSVVKPDYAKWMLDDPRVNFAISQRGREAGLNHLGVQVESAEELAEMQARLVKLQTPMLEETEAACCYAKSDKYWVNDPSGVAWETFHTLDSIPVFGEDAQPAQSAEGACCIPLAGPSDKGACCVPKQESKSAACC